MARPRNPVPKYTLHKSSGQARVCIGGREVYLGAYDSPASREAYARLVAELAVAPVPDAVPLPPAGPPPDVTVDQVVLAFWQHAEGHYRRADGTTTDELKEYRGALRPLRSLYGRTPAKRFGPLALKAVRREMVVAGLCRTTVNNRVRRLKHVFRWAAGEELVPVRVYRRLAVVAGLQKGRTAAREPDPVLPAPVEHIDAVLPRVRPAVRAMIQVQILTGMRPGEVCRLRPCDLDTTGDVWFFRPAQHKNACRGKPRAVAIGPRAREVLAAFAPADPADYYFSPRREVERLHAERTRARRTPPFPSHLARNAGKRVAAPRRPPGRCYTSHSYGVAVTRACRKAGVPFWMPNQLRHLTAAELRGKFGLEHVRAVLGHSARAMTDAYSQSADRALAAAVAAEVG
jgi:integrase